MGGQKTSGRLVFISIVLTDENEFAFSVSAPHHHVSLPYSFAVGDLHPTLSPCGEPLQAIAVVNLKNDCITFS